MESTPHHLIINTALGVKSYSGGEKVSLWKCIFFFIIIVNVAQP